MNILVIPGKPAYSACNKRQITADALKAFPIFGIARKGNIIARMENPMYIRSVGTVLFVMNR